MIDQRSRGLGAVLWGPALVAAVPWLAQAQEAPDPERLREHALTLVNGSRSEADLTELEPDEALDEAAQAHAQDMLERGYYDHVSPEGDTVLDRYLAAGGSEWELVAENIARCAGCPVPPDIERVDRLHQGWMESPGHRANILSEGVARFGFGLAAGENGEIFAVQTFAGPGVDGGSDQSGGEEALEQDEVVQLALDAINEAREEAGVPGLAASEALTEVARDLVPEDVSGFELEELDGALEALTGGGREDWAAVARVAGTCGGCGPKVTQGDVRSFLSDWLEENGYRERLLDPGMTHLGAVLRADGSGRKVALALLAQER